MIPTIEEILNGYASGLYTLESAMNWLEHHIQSAYEKESEVERYRRIFEQAAIAYITPHQQLTDEVLVSWARHTTDAIVSEGDKIVFKQETK